MRERETKKTGSAPLKTALSPGSKGRKFTAPIKIKSKPSLERIYGVQQPQTTATLQLSQTPEVKLHTPAHCALTARLTGWLARLRLSIKVKRFDSRACWRWEEGSFFSYFAWKGRLNFMLSCILLANTFVPDHVWSVDLCTWLHLSILAGTRHANCLGDLQGGCVCERVWQKYSNENGLWKQWCWLIYILA